MATHSSVLAWEPGGLLSMGSHRVGHDWSDLAAAAAAVAAFGRSSTQVVSVFFFFMAFLSTWFNVVIILKGILTSSKWTDLLLISYCDRLLLIAPHCTIINSWSRAVNCVLYRVNEPSQIGSALLVLLLFIYFHYPNYPIYICYKAQSQFLF